MSLNRVTRFAPTPNGGLHFGSLVAALASYLFCKAGSQSESIGVWKLRFDDLDTLRNAQGAVSLICSQLEAYGFEWDGTPILQSDHHAEYFRALIELCDKGLLFFCSCSRAELDRSGVKRNRWGERVYDGRCRWALATEDEVQKVVFQNTTSSKLRSLRVLVRESERFSEFFDGCQGQQGCDLFSEWGNPLVLRSDGIFSYYLANVVDDSREKVTHVVRGADLLGATHVHLFLHKVLYSSQPPEYFHVPLATDQNGKKLSKSESAAVLPLEKSEIICTLNRALRHLGQKEIADAASARELIERAVENFNGFAPVRIGHETA